MVRIPDRGVTQLDARGEVFADMAHWLAQCLA